MAERSILKESLAGEFRGNTTKDLVMSHGYPPQEPLQPEQVFNFISESTHILNTRITTT